MNNWIQLIKSRQKGLAIFFYLGLQILLVASKSKPYAYNLSSLIGIWQGFAEPNASYMQPGFVVLKNGGYDGQFFYLLAKYLYTSDPAPYLDAFFLRFYRIGLPLLSGLITSLFGFAYYPIITLLLLHLVHIASYVVLHKMLPKQYASLSLFYLFSPFLINTNLLLVCDAFFTANIIFTLHYLHKGGIDFLRPIPERSLHRTLPKYRGAGAILIAVLLCFYLLLIRETAAFIIAPLCLYLLLQKRYAMVGLFSLPLLAYLVFRISSKHWIQAESGSNPLSFFQLIDYPFFGLYKSLAASAGPGWKAIIRKLGKLPIFIYYIFLVIQIFNIRSLRLTISFLPILCILGVSAIAEQGYWLSFDNISRMFAFSTPVLILLRAQNPNYKTSGIFAWHLVLLLLLGFRILILKEGMQWYVWK
ncbi:MAG: hypothetical protein AAF518_01335 [Spirochaetota bacterium]